MKTHKIAVLSDTHGLLRPEVIECAQSCEGILHAGDFDNQKVFGALQQIAPLYAVRGNNDRGWAAKLGEDLEITLFGLRIYMVHNRKHLKKDLSGIHLVVYGHSHKYEERRDGGICYLNPGSCGPRRFALPLTMALGETHGDGSFQVRRIQIGLLDSKTQRDGQIGAGDMRRVVRKVMRDVDRGAAVEKIAARNHISSRLAEQICRLYLTHPGVDEEGILKKMGL